MKRTIRAPRIRWPAAILAFLLLGAITSWALYVGPGAASKARAASTLRAPAATVEAYFADLAAGNLKMVCRHFTDAALADLYHAGGRAANLDGCMHDADVIHVMVRPAQLEAMKHVHVHHVTWRGKRARIQTKDIDFPSAINATEIDVELQRIGREWKIVRVN